MPVPVLFACEYIYRVCIKEGLDSTNASMTDLPRRKSEIKRTEEGRDIEQ